MSGWPTGTRYRRHFASLADQPEVDMYRLKRTPLRLLTAGLAVLIVACSPEVDESELSGGAGVTLFEGARLIVGDGRDPLREDRPGGRTGISGPCSSGGPDR